ncbi:MAG: TonB-dependent receptor plug domain-containing protein, partial [Bacteroidales bacterium]|nr:TonB-dependent receptor plug domain-containing protein [Bacteroidales bacterium]
MAQERDSVVYGSTKVQDTLTQSMVSANGWKSPMISSAPLATIGRESISMASSIDIGDVIKRFAGANVKDYGGIGGLKTVSVRSLGAQHTAVTYDGAPVSNAQSGQIDISRFGTENVESVSFQIGQGNDIFIPAILLSAAGVLSISNMMPKFEDGKRVAFNGKVAYGSFKTFEAGLKLSHNISKGWSADIMGDFLTSDGSYPFSIPNAKEVYNAVRNNSDIKSYRIEGNLFGFDGHLRAKVYYHGSERGLPGSVVLYNPISNERLRDKSAIAQISYGNNIGKHVEIKGVAKYSFDWARYTDTSEQYPGGKIDDVYDQREGYGSIAVKYMPIKSLSLALAQDISYNTLKASIYACPDPSRISFYTSLGASWEMKRFSITATLLNVVMREKVAYGNPAPARNRLSPSVSASVKPFSD